jgi:hypothetical protein
LLQFYHVFSTSDNQGSIKLTGNPVSNNRTKHIDIRHFFLRERVALGHISFKFVQSEDMLADALTKASTEQKISSFKQECRVVESSAVSAGLKRS